MKLFYHTRVRELHLLRKLHTAYQADYKVLDIYLCHWAVKTHASSAMAHDNSTMGSVTACQENMKYIYQNIIKIIIHSSCEIESLQAVCDTPIARITGCVSSLRI